MALAGVVAGSSSPRGSGSPTSHTLTLDIPNVDNIGDGGGGGGGGAGGGGSRNTSSRAASGMDKPSSSSSSGQFDKKSKNGSSSNLRRDESSAGLGAKSTFGSIRLTADDAVKLQEQQQQLAHGVQVSDLELENIKRIFQQYDADGSNSIDIDELSLVMVSLGVQMDQQQLTELVEQVTNEGEQELTFDEFVSLITLWKEAAAFKLFEGDGFESLAKQHIDNALQSSSFVPDKPLRSAWDVAVAVVALLYWIFCLLLDAYSIDQFDWRGLLAGDIVCTLFLVADIIVCAQTAFMRDGRTIDSTTEVWSNYRDTWLVPDVLAAIPFDLMLTAAGATLGAAILRHLRLLKLLKLPYLWRSSDVTPITSGYITFHFHLLPIFQLIISFFVMVHGFAVGWILLKQNMCSDSGSDRVLVRTNRTLFDNTTVTECYYPYTPAIYFIIYSLSTVGLGDVSVTGDAEFLYASLVLVGAMASNGIVIGKLVQILQRADIKKEQRSKIRETLAVLEHFHIANQLQTEILQFQAHVFENNLGAAYESIISGLPAEMRNNISLFVRMKLVSVVPLFQESHFMLRIAVAQVLTNAVARPEQYVCVAGQQLDGLFFLAYGFADTFDPKGGYQNTLRSGDFFGEESLVGSGFVSESVKALTFCDLWILQGDTFNMLLARFPKFRRTVELLRSVNAEVVLESESVSATFSRRDSMAAIQNRRDSVATGSSLGKKGEDVDDDGSGQQEQRRDSGGGGADDGASPDGDNRRKSIVTWEASGNNVLKKKKSNDDDEHDSTTASTPDGGQKVVHPTMSVAEIHDFVDSVRAFKERLRQAALVQ